MYKVAAEDVSQDIDITKWWKNHQNELPVWANEASKIGVAGATLLS